MTIANVDIPKLGDTDYESKLITAFNAIDNHDHGANNGEPVKALDSSLVDNSTVEMNASKIRVKSAGLTAAKFSGGVAQTGTLMAYVGTSAPSGWLLCHGAAVSRTTYSALFAVIGEAWGEGDNSTTFNLPDMRGLFLRGRDRGTAVDPNAATRTALATGGATGDNVGSYQADDVKQHTHTGNLTTGIRGGYNDGKVGVGGHWYGTPTAMNTNATTGLTGGTYKEGTANSNESRPVNVAVNWIIKT